ncbi:MAG TPA: dTDP-4-dehydrorhamnose 3,5-epimerase [Pirellulales bacterium]|jgi:dTDP-4-dehydrorhamnose 3,5-epimerase|nr:dTDP-4-dehydrorhamnose 3,5-epimerase [Pirellulales bacterium]
MRIVPTELPGVILVEPAVHGDHRGFFVEVFRGQWLHDLGIDGAFVQDNHSRSRRGVLRGLHYQLEHAQGKLVRAARGEIFDVAVDVRRGSPTFGRWFGAVLDDTSHRQMYVPPGFAHGFCVLSETADVIYKTTDYYHPASERGLLWNDPAIGIRWPISDVTLSPRDMANPHLADARPENLPA